MERVEIKKEILEALPIGCFFQFETYDSDDNTYWTLKYCKSKKGYIYLGGGVDFGSAIGKIETAIELIEYINANDYPSIELCKLIIEEQYDR